MSYKKYNVIIKLYFILLCLVTLHSNAMNPEIIKHIANMGKVIAAHEEENRQKFRDLMNNCNSIQDIKYHIATYLYQEQDQIKEFMNKPIGKALEWYTLTRQMSRGKAIYATPLFMGLFVKSGLRFPYSTEANGLVYLKISNNKVSMRNYSSQKQTLCNIANKNITRMSGHGHNNSISGQELEAFLDRIAAQLFMLSKSEMHTYIKILHREESNLYLLSSDIKNIHAINKKIAIPNNSPFLEWKDYFYIKTPNTHSLKDSYMVRGILLIPPLVLTGMSSCIQHNLSLSSVHNIDEENHLRSLVNELITQSHDERLIKYLYPSISGSLPSRLSHFLKINSPFLLCFAPDIIGPYQPSFDITRFFVSGSVVGSLCFIVSTGMSLIMPVDSLKAFFMWCGCLFGLVTIAECARICHMIYKNEHWNDSTMTLEKIVKNEHWLWNGGRIL